MRETTGAPARWGGPVASIPSRLVTAPEISEVGDADLGSLEFWGRPAQERDRYEDIRSISRDPATFCSGEGVQFGDAPQEILEASQSFLAIDTSRHTTSHAMGALTLHPEQRAWLLEDLDGRLPGAVEEFVRWATPVLTFRRTTTREVQLHGQTLRAGEKVVRF